MRNFVLTTFPFSDSERDTAWNRLARYWIEHLVAQRWRADIGYHWWGYRMARSVDPEAHRRLVRALRGQVWRAARRRCTRPALRRTGAR